MNGPLKWHGGKTYLATKIRALMPPHIHYVEPYAGGLSVLLSGDGQGVSEVANDLDGRLMNFWRCLACPATYPVFERKANFLPFSEAVWEMARERLSRPCETPDQTCLGCGIAFFVHCRMSMAGRMKTFSPITKARTRRGMNEQASAWLGAVEGLPEVHARLKRVVLLNRPALKVIGTQDGKDTCFYLDPPYMHETRGGHTPSDYAHEMTDQDHRNLLCELRDIKGKFLLSGYHNDTYDGWAEMNNFKCHEFDMPNHAASGESKRRMTECVWTNF